MIESVNVPEVLGRLPVGAVFTHANPDIMPDSWVKVGKDSYRRTYDWLTFSAADFKTWNHVELTEPVDGSITQEEADQREAIARSRVERLRQSLRDGQRGGR
jgi:hypothetical protein